MARYPLVKAHEPNDIAELYLPGKNEFIPSNVEVEKREVSQVRLRTCSVVYFLTNAKTKTLASQAAKSD